MENVKNKGKDKRHSLVRKTRRVLIPTGNDEVMN